jgi:hypothetical protein
MNNNWKEHKDGWHKQKNSETRGNASYFRQTPPPMRDSLGRPMRNADEIDTAKWIEEVNNGEWKPKN